MKILFEQIKGGSGVDVWTNSLSKELTKQDITSSVAFYPSYYLFFPYVLKFENKRESNYDVIHCNTWDGFAFKTNVPMVVTDHHVVHDSALHQYKTFAQKMYHRFVFEYEKSSLKVADAVTCVSNYTKQKLEEIFGYYDSKVIYNGIDTNIFKPKSVKKESYGIDEGKTILFFVGNLSRRKGADLLPKIMGKLGDDFLLLTTSGLRKDLKRELKNIKTIGRLSEKELVNVYNLGDIFLFPSRSEGFGLTVAEAMACGKPVVTTNCSSLPELVVDGKGGFLCEMDDVKDFADNIELLAEDENLRMKMGEFNRKRVLERFTLEKMGAEYLKIYQSL